jgi:hypothetical protein
MKRTERNAYMSAGGDRNVGSHMEQTKTQVQHRNVSSTDSDFTNETQRKKKTPSIYPMPLHV